MFVCSEESVKCCTGDEAFNVFNQLKEPNKSVLGYLACFVSHVSTFAAETGVNDNALASVFSPCIMKCPYTDVKEMIAATEKQTFFVLGLLNAASSGLITSEEFKLSLAKTKPKAETPSSRNRNRSGEANSASDDDDDDDGNNNNGEEKPPPLPSTPPPLIPSCFSSPPPPPPSLSISNQQIK